MQERKLEAMKHQGKVIESTCAQVGHKSRDVLADDVGESRETVRRYIRLTNLIKPLLQMVDDRRIAMSPAVRLKTLYQQGDLNEGMMVKIMSEQKANQKDKLTFQAEKFAAYFPRGYTAEQMEQSIIRMLDERKRQMQRNRDDAR